MEDTKDTNGTPGTQISAEQAGEVGGGDGTSCSTTVTVVTPAGSIQSTYSSFGDALIGTYDGLVDAASHVIERVATSMK